MHVAQYGEQGVVEHKGFVYLRNCDVGFSLSQMGL